MAKSWSCALVAVFVGLMLSLPGALSVRAEEAPTAGFPDAARRAKTRKPIPLHLSVGSGVFEPWDGDRGWNLSGSLHVGLGSDRFWVGGEFEYRRYQAEVKRDFRPDMNTFLLRFSFQYHPFPHWVVSPYCGIQVGVALHQSSDRQNDSGRTERSKVSAGTTMLGLAGVEVPLFTQRAHFFAEGRLGNTSDIWKKRGGNWQMDQVDGITGMGGLRFRF